MADQSQFVRERFDAAWRARVRPLVTDETVEEHRRSPRGEHSDALERLLRFLRSRPPVGKHVVVATEPWREYRIGVLTDDPERPVDVLDDQVFDDYDAVLHAIFLLRIAQLEEA